MNALPINLTPQQLRRAADLKERIDSLQNELAGLLGSLAHAGYGATPTKRKRRMSAAGRAAISAATRARWARIRAGTLTSAPKPKKTMSAAARARIAASQRARWAAIKGSGAPSESAPKRKRKLSAAGRAALSLAAKTRWRIARAKGKATL